jgi:hypothetical protein
MELNASFRSRCDAEVEAQQGHQYMAAHLPFVIQYLWENLEQDDRVVFVTWLSSLATLQHWTTAM